MPTIKRVYHPFAAWECFIAGMWFDAPSSERAKLLNAAIEFTGDANLYGQWMLKVTQEWTRACEHHLTDPNINKRAWVGHAACCMATGCPEHITRSAWRHLTAQQQDEANAVADIAIAAWTSARTTGDTIMQMEFWDAA